MRKAPISWLNHLKDAAEYDEGRAYSNQVVSREGIGLASGEKKKLRLGRQQVHERNLSRVSSPNTVAADKST